MLSDIQPTGRSAENITKYGNAVRYPAYREINIGLTLVKIVSTIYWN